MTILDTNVLSELMRPRPNADVTRWIASQPAISLFTTTLTQAEILYGLALLEAGRRRDEMTVAARAIFEVDLAGRVLPFDSAAAVAFATIAADRRRAGRSLGTIDVQIAAVASSRSARLATRNVRDFDDCGITVVDPWTHCETYKHSMTESP